MRVPPLRRIARPCAALALAALCAAPPLVAQSADEPGTGAVAVVEEEIVEEAVAVGDAAGDADATDTAGDEAGAAENGALNYTFVQLVEFGGLVGYVIIALSVVAVALIIDYALLLRPKVLMPPPEVAEIRELVNAGRAAELASGDPRPSFVGGVTAAGAAELGRSYDAMVKAMEDRADELTGRLLRRIEYLNMIANVAPMLGLLGTVIGMVQCFNQISVAAGGADPRLLAAGIFQALMTTVMGLLVAIPTFFAFSIFRNRVDALAADATAVAEEIMTPLRPMETAATPSVARIGRA